MKNMPPQNHPLHALLARLMGDQLDAAGWERLQDILLESPQARAQYLDQMILDALLCWDGRGANHLGALRLGDSVSLENPVGDSVLLENSVSASSDSSMHDAMQLPAIVEEDVIDHEEDSIDHAETPPPPKEYARRTGSARRFRTGWLRRGGNAAAILLCLGAVAVLVRLFFGSSTPLFFGSSTPPPITLGACLDAVWSDPDSDQAIGSEIPIGVPQSLASGFVELRSLDGLTVVIQGPASFSVPRNGCVQLNSGKLTARVPHKARGFSVVTPVATVVDLGTEFGVTVSASGDTDVDTFRGTVAVTPSGAVPDTARSLVVAGVAKHIDAAGDVTGIAPNASAFVTPQEFENRAAAAQDTPYTRWRSYSQRLRLDPDLVAYYDFAPDSANRARLVNLSSMGTALDGTLGGANPGDSPAWAVGRWPQKGALAFAAGSHQRVEVPAPAGGPLDFSRGTEETASSFTICAWVHGDGPQPGEGGIVAKGVGYHEQFALETFYDMDTKRETLRAIVRAPDLVGLNSVDRADINEHCVIGGSWNQVALVYRSDAGVIELFLNGDLLHSQDNISHELVETGRPMIIGGREANDLAKIPTVTANNMSYFNSLVGRMDELAIFRRALSAEQIRVMYAAERPE
jgi:hypothetical protein